MDLYVLSTQEGDTALTWASYKGQLEVVKALLAAGADKEARDYEVCGDVSRWDGNLGEG